MLNKDIYNKAPQENRLVNNGVAEVSEDHSEAAQAILRYELESFVCDGQYEKGLETILDKFLLNLDSGSEQPGVWISGFYGSGKSHLAKMLRTLWTDYQFADGATARSLAKLPTGVFEHLKELSTQGKRYGALHAAAGKLGAGAGDKVRLALLGIIFKSKGLPEQYNQAQFVLWLTREGLLAQVESELHAASRSLTQELPHMYVSSHLAKALLKARPDLAHTEADARKLLKEQFPQVTDVTSDQMTTAIADALTVDGHFPLTLVVLDEVQQFIGADAEKAFQVQEVTETLSKHFNGKLLFVGTGQSALSGMPNLQRLMGRFPVQVMLGDWDVENVTRQIILAKKPTAMPEVEHVWRANLGEISRHLRGTKLEHVTEDEDVMTSDYPLLPVRRRFWERVLRTIDTTGTVSQLRSQLRVVHEAVLATADAPLGHVVSGDFLYDQIAANLVSTAQLPKEVFENVQRFAAGDANSQLKAKLLKLVCFDEVSGVSFDQKDGVNIMKGYMESGEFSRGKESIRADGSIVLVGNFDVDVEHQQRVGHLFGPLPPEMRDDTAFMDRIHCFLPGWEVPKLSPGLFTEHFGLVSDFLSECFTQLRGQSRVSALQARVYWGGALSGRDINGVNKTVSGLLKLLYPDAEAQVSEEDLEWAVRLALEVRRRVKEQQKRIGAAEFRNTHFSYTLGTEGVEKFVSTPELQSQGGIGDEPLECGQIWTLSPGGQDEHPGLFRLEVTEGPGSGVRVLNNPVPSAFKESIRCAEQNLYARAQQLVGDRDPRSHEFSVQLRGFDAAKSGAKTGIGALIALAGALLKKSVRGGLVVVGEVTLGGTIEPIHNAVTLAELAVEKGAKSLLLPVSCRRQLFDLSDQMATKLDIEFYQDGRDALLKALVD